MRHLNPKSPFVSSDSDSKLTTPAPSSSRRRMAPAPSTPRGKLTKMSDIPSAPVVSLSDEEAIPIDTSSALKRLKRKSDITSRSLSDTEPESPATRSESSSDNEPKRPATRSLRRELVTGSDLEDDSSETSSDNEPAEEPMYKSSRKEETEAINLISGSSESDAEQEDLKCSSSPKRSAEDIELAALLFTDSEPEAPRSSSSKRRLAKQSEANTPKSRPSFDASDSSDDSYDSADPKAKGKKPVRRSRKRDREESSDEERARAKRARRDRRERELLDKDRAQERRERRERDRYDGEDDLRDLLFTCCICRKALPLDDYSVKVQARIRDGEKEVQCLEHHYGKQDNYIEGMQAKAERARSQSWSPPPKTPKQTRLSESVQSRRNNIIDFGEHRGETFSRVFQESPTYVRQFVMRLTTPSARMLKFQAWVRDIDRSGGIEDEYVEDSDLEDLDNGNDERIVEFGNVVRGRTFLEVYNDQSPRVQEYREWVKTRGEANNESISVLARYLRIGPDEEEEEGSGEVS
jgi:hypothetical protein